MKKNRLVLLVAGGLIATIGFFLPWFEYEGESAFSIAIGYDPSWQESIFDSIPDPSMYSFWIILASAVGILITFRLARFNSPVQYLPASIALAGALSVVIHIIGFNQYWTEGNSPEYLAAHPFSSILKVGGLISLLGFALSLLAQWLLVKDNRIAKAVNVSR